MQQVAALAVACLEHLEQVVVGVYLEQECLQLAAVCSELYRLWVGAGTEYCVASLKFGGIFEDHRPAKHLQSTLRSRHQSQLKLAVYTQPTTIKLAWM